MRSLEKSESYAQCDDVEKAKLHAAYDSTTLGPSDYRALGLNPWESYIKDFCGGKLLTNKEIEARIIECKADDLFDKIERMLIPVPGIAWEHANISARMCYETFKPVVKPLLMQRILSLMVRARNLTDSSLACFLIAFVAGAEREKILNFLEKTRILEIEDETQMVKAFTKSHTIIRSTQVWIDGTYLTAEESGRLQYMKELLSRRDYKEEIWFDDIGQRLREGPIKRFFHYDALKEALVGSKDEFTQRLHRAIKECFAQIADKLCTSIKTFDEFWDDRHTWVASGSAPGFVLEIPVYRYVKNDKGEIIDAIMEKTERVRMNKRAAFEQITKQQYLEELSQKPYIYSTGVIKRENAKLRNLYNTNMSHYISQAYIMEQIEPLLGAVEGYDLNFKDEQLLTATRERQKYAKKNSNGLWMWDYADFNVQHENEDMSCLWEAMRDIVSDMAVTSERQKTAKEDWVKICTWVSEAEHNAYITDPSHRLGGIKKRGLLTGSRATQFTNTILNICYAKVLREQYKELFRIDPIIYTLNHGDDVFAATESRADAVGLTHLSRVMGLAGNVEKAAIEFGEYLRIHYDEGGMQGHQLRSIANIVTRDWQSAEDYREDEKLKATVNQFRKATSRGADREMLELLLQREIEEYRKVKRSRPIRKMDGTREYVDVISKIPREWIESSVLNNGAGIGSITKEPEIRRYVLPKLKTRVHLSKRVRDYYGDEMTNDFWKKLHKLFPEMVNADPIHLAQIKHTYKADNIMGALPTFIKRSLNKKYAKQIEEYIKKIRELRTSGRAREVAEIIGEAQHIAIRNEARSDIAKMMRYWDTTEIRLWHREINPMLMAEREIAKLPSKRKDVVSAWVESLMNLCGVSQWDALGRLTIALGSKDTLPELLPWMESVMPAKLAYQAIMGEITFDNILGGYVAPEVEQTVRNEAIWRAMEVISSMRGKNLNVKMIATKAQLQAAVRTYESEVRDVVLGDKDIYNRLRG
jgi:hypothetical protein